MPGHVIANDLIVKTEEITAGSAKYFGVETSQPLLMADANVVKIDGVVKLRQGASPLRLRMELQGSNDLWLWFVVATFETQAASNPNLWLSTGSGTDLGESAPQSFATLGAVETSYAYVRVRWVLYVETGSLAINEYYQVTASVGLGRKMD